MLSNAKWIISPVDMGDMSTEFRFTLKLGEKLSHATVYASAYGVYNFYVNGKPASRAFMAPGCTDYNNFIQYQTYDITELLADESSAVFSIVTGLGWAESRLGHPTWPGYTAKKSRLPAAIAAIRLEYSDGSCESIVTDERWDTYTTHIMISELYDGETYDLTSEIKFIGHAILDPVSERNLIAQIGPLSVERERISPAKLIITPKGERVIDFGQNLAGYVEFRIKGKRCDRIRISHAEVLDRDGNFYTDNMRLAKNECIYVLDGEENLLKPHFSFQGFRYIRLDEYPFDEVDLNGICAVAVYSDLRRTGHFSSGNAKINQLYSNVIWGQRSNFLDIPTDCPQRDERYGWTGDAQVFCRTAAINYDVESFFRKWLTDMRFDQEADGSVGGTVPYTRQKFKSLTSAAWGDAATICPYEIYRAYGNRELLAENFEMMKRWVEYVHKSGDEEYLWIGGTHYGDWLGMDAGAGVYFGATQTDLIASAFFAKSTALVIEAGKILGEDVSCFEELYRNVRRAFRAAFMKDGLPVIYPKADALSTNRPVKAPTQTGIALILAFGLCEDCERDTLVNKLAELIAENGGLMSTGFVGTPYLLHALSQNGRADLAYDLLLEERKPSWLFSVNNGATTMWEHWDGVDEDGNFWSADMNSFNHYAYGAVYDWIFGVALGIDVDMKHGGAGYKRIIYAPVPNERLGFAEGSIETAYGKISSRWSYLCDGSIRYELDIPDGVTATAMIKGLPLRELSGGSYVFTV